MKFRDLHLTVQIRLIEGFCGSLLTNMVFPFMVIYFAQYFGGELAGILLVVNIVVGMLTNFYGGYVADKYGRKKVMMFAQFAFILAFSVMALCNSPWFFSPEITFAMTMIQAVTGGFMGPAAMAMLIDVTTQEDRKFVFGLQYWLTNLSLTLSGLVGGFLFMTHRFELLAGLALLAVLNLLVLIFFIAETYVPSEEQRLANSKGILPDIANKYKVVFRDKTFMLFMLATTLVASVEWIARNYSSVRLSQEFGTQSLLGFHVDGVQMFGFLASENSLLVVLLGLFATAFVRKRQERSILFWAIPLTAVGFAAMSVSNSAWVLLLVMAMATVGEVLWVPIIQALSAELPPAENRSAYMAVNALPYRLTQMIGGLAVTVGALTSAIFMGALVMVIALTSLWLFDRLLKKIRSKQETTALSEEASAL